jgi:hypothetical protein
MYGNVISCDCHSMPCSFVIIGSGNSLNIAVKCQSTNAMRFCCNCSHKHIPSTPLRGQPRSPSIPHAAASSARVTQTRPHPRAAALSASFRDEVLSAPPRPVALSGAGTRTPPAAAEAASGHTQGRRRRCRRCTHLHPGGGIVGADADAPLPRARGRRLLLRRGRGRHLLYGVAEMPPPIQARSRLAAPSSARSGPAAPPSAPPGPGPPGPAGPAPPRPVFRTPPPRWPDCSPACPRGARTERCPPGTPP